WHLTKQAMGPAMAAALVGMIIGAAGGGRLGDAWGRRPLLIACLGCFGVATLLTSLADGPVAVAWLRWVAGIGFGAGLSNAMALTAESGSVRSSFQTVNLVILGIPVGGMLGAAIANALLPAFGWRAVFGVAGALPCMLALAMYLLLPESPRFLSRRAEAAAGRTDSAAARPGWRSLMKPAFRRSTLGLGLAFFASLAVSYAFFSWIPTMMVSLGYSGSIGIRAALLFNLFGALGAALGGKLLSPFGGRIAPLTYVGIGIISMGLLTMLILGAGRGDADPGVLTGLLIGLSAAGIANIGTQAALYGLAATAYPTELRATGIGLAASVGRTGALLSAYFGGAILSAGSGSSMFLVLAGALYLLSGLGVLIVDRLPARTRVDSA
ncbi:MAG: MFS transporter, partial [Steroidobacteraceae bacterium]